MLKICNGIVLYFYPGLPHIPHLNYGITTNFFLSTKWLICSNALQDQFHFVAVAKMTKSWGECACYRLNKAGSEQWSEATEMYLVKVCQREKIFFASHLLPDNSIKQKYNSNGNFDRGFNLGDNIKRGKKCVIK